MLDKKSYISQVEKQINQWNGEVHNFGDKASGKRLDQFNEAKNRVENKLDAFRKSDDLAVGFWETEIDNLRNQAQGLLNAVRSSTH